MSSMWYIWGVNKSMQFPPRPILSRRDFSLWKPTSLRTNFHIDRVYVKVLSRLTATERVQFLNWCQRISHSLRSTHHATNWTTYTCQWSHFDWLIQRWRLINERKRGWCTYIYFAVSSLPTATNLPTQDHVSPTLGRHLIIRSAKSTLTPESSQAIQRCSTHISYGETKLILLK